MERGSSDPRVSGEGYMDINWLAVFAAAASSFILGGVWYSALFAKQWQTAAGVSDVQIKNGNMPLIFGQTMKTSGYGQKTSASAGS